jgi:hypothetical protein
MVAPPPPLSPPESVWKEVSRVCRPILVDILVFVMILMALFFGFFGLRMLELAGFDEQRVRTLETMHYWFYAGVFGLFGLDLIYKIFCALFLRNKDRSV